jgi:hypothetical protein
VQAVGWTFNGRSSCVPGKRSSPCWCPVLSARLTLS